jgi:3-hydroxyacyl-CoA dehydrogenase
MKSSRAGRRAPKQRSPAAKPRAGVVGLGLMGTSIIACLLARGHRVIGITRDLKKRRRSKRHILDLLREMKRERLLVSDPAEIAGRFTASEDFASLRDCDIVLESILENIELKRQVIARVEGAVTPACLIGSNTSALPVTQLQQGAQHPERILGIHWAEPAHITRFMEVICGDQTAPESAQRVMQLARGWGKEPTLVRRDVRGFITNRIMYAILREAFYLVENGYATPADVDRSVRNDYGYWMTLAGPFRFMDLTGIPAYEAVMRDLWPELSCAKEVPKLMRELVASGALGVANAKGFYKYTEAEARRWEKRFLRFTYEIRALAQKYPDQASE